MILLDSSVVIDYLRGKDTKLLALFAALPLAVCGVVRAEVLAGARSAAEWNRLINLLDSFTQIPISDAHWDTVGNHLRALRAGGISIPFPDAVLVKVAIHNAHEFWTRDAHFSMVQPILPALKLFQEPP